MPEVKFSCPTLLVSMRVWPDGKSSATERKSGYQVHLHNFTVAQVIAFSTYFHVFQGCFIKMPRKRSKSKISFKIFSTENYSKFANKFPFLEERQIKAKLLQAWRNRFTTETKKAKGEFKITKHLNEAPFNEGKTLSFFYEGTNIGWCCVIPLGN